ncbi:MAG: Omp28 family outer membrane lipoprotein [Bacteroidia bacterium]|nr:Omp28 family outer membrane lipoprotein [Bacteroidia bacterium]MDW8158271.1 Omp28 family outer membrane lipoprotein [Bacteroidia bacterium]
MKIFYYFFSIFALLFIIEGCDVIEPPYKENNIPTPSRGTNQQKVLLEDFTGFLCGNCPTASKEADRLKKIYQDRLVLIRIHAGPLATPNSSHTLDLRTQTGNELDAYFGVTPGGIPRALINRRKWNNNLILTRGNWAACVDSFLKEPAPALLILSTQYNSTTRQITATATIDSIQAPSVEDHISFYVIEDSIIGYQKDYSLANQNIYNYVHNETLRGSLNGTWGQPVFEEGNISKRKTITVRGILPPEWKAHHCKIVAILYRKKDTSRQVLQVEQSKYLSNIP